VRQNRSYTPVALCDRILPSGLATAVNDSRIGACMEQELDDRLIRVVVCRTMQRCLAKVVLAVRIGAHLQQQCDDLHVRVVAAE